LSTYQYAAYGSNLHPVRLQLRVPSARLLGSGSLPGYQLRFNKRSSIDGSGKCSINAGDGVVHLAVFEIATAEKPELDRIEGLGKGYDQIILELENFGDCLSYIAEPSAIDETLHPMDWYREMVILGCIRNRFPGEYVRGLELFKSIQDENPGRASENWKIVDAMRNDA